MDEEKLETLKRWGSGLMSDEREEVRAAGKAIVMLAEEVEQLHIELWKLRDASSQEREEGEPLLFPGAREPAIERDLRSRLLGVFRSPR